MDNEVADQATPEHMKFHAMDEMSTADYEVLKHVHQENLDHLPELLLGFLDYANEPVETFIPMVHRVLGMQWSPPTAHE